MGGRPLFALNIVGFPINELPKSILTSILQGGIDKAKEADIPIVVQLDMKIAESFK